VADKTCQRCGTPYTPSVIDVCPHCGAPAGAAGTAGEAAPADETVATTSPAAPEPGPYRPPGTGSDPPQQPRGGRGGGGAGLLAWFGTLVMIAIAGGAVWLAFGSGSGSDDEAGDGALTAQTDDAPTQATMEPPTTETRATTTTRPPETTRPQGVAPLVRLAPLRAQDRRCLGRWNARLNRALRRQAFAAATGGRRVGSVQLVPPGQPTMALHCVVLIGVQPRGAEAASPGRIYVEGLPFTSGASRWVPLPTAFLSYQWNARMRAGGRLDAPRR